ncbi:AurF N-oxygenase family protein [Actinoallomurus acaciae]|uniref:Diiron oxygenase n=1 Tax=Actinoallomurus acaciae TaxID=502577 RepID=A0ABV5YH99_9ACTN
MLTQPPPPTPGAPTVDDRSYTDVVDRLSRSSVRKSWSPYRDIPWDDPEFGIDPADPRWRLPDADRLSATRWYQGLSPAVQARLGLWRVTAMMQTGVQFENILKRGLLTFARRLPAGSPAFRYAYHEVIEEANHGMMFREFVTRTGLPVPGLPAVRGVLAELVPLLPWLSPELFLIFALAGEEPIDHAQRRVLREASRTHPLQVRIMRIHVAEEARHVSFARHHLRHRVPRLGRLHRTLLALAMPVVVRIVAGLVLGPPCSMNREFAIPRRVRARAYRDPAWRAEFRAAVAGPRHLAAELGLMTPAGARLWRLLGLSDTDPRKEMTR